MRILSIENESTPLCLALEEYFLQNLKEPACLIWRAGEAVVIGRHQLAHAESDPLWREENQVPLYRRVSGGGAVFHDPGNLSFCFIRQSPNPPRIDYAAALEPVQQALAQLGVRSHFHAKSDLYIGEKKISGNAIRAQKGCLLHHGTLLYQSNLERLSAALAGNLDRYESRAVPSTRSSVTNISEHLDHAPEPEVFQRSLADAFLKTFPNARLHNPTDEERSAAEQIARERYSEWSWNIGSGPNYRFAHNGVTFMVEGGKIRGADAPVPAIATCLEGARHEPRALRPRFIRLQQTESILRRVF